MNYLQRLSYLRENSPRYSVSFCALLGVALLGFTLPGSVLLGCSGAQASTQKSSSHEKPTVETPVGGSQRSFTSDLAREAFGDPIGGSQGLPAELGGTHYTDPTAFLGAILDGCAPSYLTHAPMDDGDSKLASFQNRLPNDKIDYHRQIAKELLADVQKHYTVEKMTALQERLASMLNEHEIKTRPIGELMLWAGPIPDYSECAIIRESAISEDLLNILYFGSSRAAFKHLKSYMQSPENVLKISKAAMKLTASSIEENDASFRESKIGRYHVGVVAREYFNQGRVMTSGQPLAEVLKLSSDKRTQIGRAALKQIAQDTALLGGDVLVKSLDEFAGYTIATVSKTGKEDAQLVPTIMLANGQVVKSSGRVVPVHELDRSTFSTLTPELAAQFTQHNSGVQKLRGLLDALSGDKPDVELEELKQRLAATKRQSQATTQKTDDGYSNLFFGSERFLQKKDPRSRGVVATAICTDEHKSKYDFQVRCSENDKGQPTCEPTVIPDECTYLEKFALKNPVKARKKHPRHPAFRFLPTKMPQANALTFTNGVRAAPEVKEAIWNEVVARGHAVLWSKEARELLSGFGTVQVRHLQTQDDIQYHTVKFNLKNSDALEHHRKLPVNGSGCQANVFFDGGYDTANIWLSKNGKRFAHDRRYAFKTDAPSTQLQMQTIAKIADADVAEVHEIELGPDEISSLTKKFRQELNRTVKAGLELYTIRQEGDCENEGLLKKKLSERKKWFKDYTRLYVKPEIINTYSVKGANASYDARVCFACKNGDGMACLDDVDRVDMESVRSQCTGGGAAEQRDWFNAPQKKKPSKLDQFFNAQVF